MCYNVLVINKTKCLNPKCPSHKTKDFQFRKMGKTYIKTRKAYVQRYRCKTCNKTFQASSFKESKTYQEKHEELKTKIQTLHCSGMTIRQMSKFLKIARTTIARYLMKIGQESKAKYEDFEKFNYLDSYHITTIFDVKTLRPQKKSPLLVFDEMETHLVSAIMPLSIGIAYDYYNDKIIAIRTCGFVPRRVIPPLTRDKKDFKKEYQRIYGFDFKDHRVEMSREVFELMRKYSDSTTAKNRVIITDGKTNYPKDIAKAFSGLVYDHQVFKTKGIPSVDDKEDYDMLDANSQLKPADELRNKDYFKLISKSALYKQHHISAFAKFNKVCSLLRLNLSTLHRKSLCTIKNVDNFQDSLFVFQDWYNSRILTKEELKAKKKRDDDRKATKGY